MQAFSYQLTLRTEISGGETGSSWNCEDNGPQFKAGMFSTITTLSPDDNAKRQKVPVRLLHALHVAM